MLPKITASLHSVKNTFQSHETNRTEKVCIHSIICSFVYGILSPGALFEMPQCHTLLWSINSNMYINSAVYTIYTPTLRHVMCVCLQQYEQKAHTFLSHISTLKLKCSLDMYLCMPLISMRKQNQRKSLAKSVKGIENERIRSIFIINIDK